jgi:threonine aldolase
MDARPPDSNIMYFDLDGAKLSARRLDEATERSLRVGRFAGASQLSTAQAFAALIERSHKCKISTYGDTRLRVVLHHQVSDDDVERLIAGAAEAAAKLAV